MVENEKINYLPWAIISILSILLITIIITFIVQLQFLKHNYKNDFDKHRCKIELLPFISLIKPELSAYKNFHFCVNRGIKPLFRETTKKLNKPVSTVNSDLNKTTEDLSKLKDESLKVREKIDEDMNNVNNVFVKTQTISYYIALKIRNFFDKISAAIISLYYMLITNANTLMIMIASIYRGIILLYLKSVFLFIYAGGMYALSVFLTSINQLYGAAVAMKNAIASTVLAVLILVLNKILITLDKLASSKAYCCFSPDSILLNGKHVCEYKLGQYIDTENNKSKILGIITSKNSHYLYQLSKNVWITGDHLIYTSNNTLKNAYELGIKTNRCPKYVMCFITDNKKILTQKHVCCDYSETQDHMSVAKITLKGLNKNYKKLKEIYEYGDERNCVSINSLIQTKKGIRKIQEISIDDEIWDGENWTNVVGNYVCSLPESHKWLNIDNIYISPSVICKYKNENWEKSYNVLPLIFDNFKNNKGYHLITSSGKFVLAGEKPLLIRDFLENTSVYEEIEKNVKNSI